jgi:hypothetical protein
MAADRQCLSSDHVGIQTDANPTEKMCFLRGPCRDRTSRAANLFSRDRSGFEYLHRSPVSCKRKTKRIPVSWSVTGPLDFCKDKNTGTWPSRLPESLMWDRQIWSWVPQDSDPRITALATTSNNYKRQAHPLLREGAPYQQTHNGLIERKIWFWELDGCLTPR